MSLELKPGSGLSFASGYEFDGEWGLRVDPFKSEAMTAHTRLVCGIPFNGLGYYFYFPKAGFFADNSAMFRVVSTISPSAQAGKHG